MCSLVSNVQCGTRQTQFIQCSDINHFDGSKDQIGLMLSTEDSQCYLLKIANAIYWWFIAHLYNAIYEDSWCYLMKIVGAILWR